MRAPTLVPSSALPTPADPAASLYPAYVVGRPPPANVGCPTKSPEPPSDDWVHMLCPSVVNAGSEFSTMNLAMMLSVNTAKWLAGSPGLLPVYMAPQGVLYAQTALPFESNGDSVLCVTIEPLSALRLNAYASDPSCT